MNIKQSIRESFIFNFLLLIRDLADNSLLFNIRREKNNNFSNSPIEYKTWIDSSLVYRILMKIDKGLRKFHSFIYTSVVNSKIYNLIYGKKKKEKKVEEKSRNPILENSKLYNFIKSISIRGILIGLTIAYIFVNFIIRRIGLPAIVGSIWDEVLLIILFMYVIFVRIKSNGEISYNFTPMGLPLAIYIILGITHAMMVAPNKSIAFEGFRAVFQQVLWYFPMAQLIRKSEDTEKVVNLMIGMGLFLGLHSVYQYIAKVPMPGNWVDVTESVRTRAFSIVGSPNILGALFVLFIPMAISMILTSKDKKSKRFYGISIVLMLLGLFFTLSRGAWLAFAFSIFIFIIIYNPKLILPFIFLGGVFILSGGTMSQRLLFMLSPSYMAKSSKAGRLYRWSVGIDRWKRNKFLGLGLGRFGGAVAMNNQLAPFYLDNYYLKTLTEMGIYGILGLAFVIIAFIIFSARIIKAQKDDKKKILAIGLFSGAIGVLAQNFVENIFEVPAMAIYVWITMAFINTLAPNEENYSLK
ncbi:MAG: O-antigen ligase family protein [Tissierellia bacterium]|nr:O-antigen ligase family protein [Tissierellia bacterium]